MPPRPRRRRLPWAVLGWAVATPAAALVVARATRHEENPLVIAVQAVTASGLVLASSALALGLISRRRLLILVSGALVAANLEWVMPQLSPARPVPPDAASAPRLRVMTVNLFTLNQHMSDLAAEISGADADVVLVQELSFGNLAVLERQGVLADYPFRLLTPRADAFGIGILSRRPLVDEEIWRAGELPMARATVMVEGRPVRVYCVHPRAPFGPGGLRRWRAEMASVQEAVEREPRPLVVAGDFNATWGQRRFRALLGTGLRDAHVERGRGWAVTWPNDARLVPPLAKVDHVLVSPELAVLGVREGVGRGSDHRPVVADLALVG